MIILWTLFAFVLGALPFSVWIGNYGIKQDIRAVADNNPGATNVYRTGGLGWFILALIFDISKGVVPVALAQLLGGIDGWQLLPIALAPPLGHAFSPFLNWKGGKAVAATFGAWIGLTLWWTVPLVAVVSVVALNFVMKSAVAVLLSLLIMLAYIFFFEFSSVWIGVVIAHFLLMTYTHRHDLF